MPIVKADRLARVSAALLRAAGASEEEADAVAVGCVNAKKLRALAREYRLDTVLDLA
ncbi:hypothetical protein [Bradyrhizobium cytisi]|uniref:hypothetical protein n=1 Tax=Bradyrhizobium cytisi TaxID=515489 RepID=UPI001FEB7788|nr:hypothetical protein [Bradyrhizobium cytisi]